MNYRQLIAMSKLHLEKTHPPRLHPATVFTLGARWMYERLRELQPAGMGGFDSHARYTAYGLLKYGICLTAAGLAGLGMSGNGLAVLPAAVLAFYLTEIHFLFLFPLLVDRVPRPLLASLKATYKIGPWRCLVTVIPIGFYMLAGLVRKNNRLTNWYIGCLAILIWYKHETRNRL
jgi:hypothetical protein